MRNKILLLLVLTLTLGLHTRASHIAGAELTVSHIQTNQYKLKLDLYVECNGVHPGTTQQVHSQAQNAYITLSMTGSAPVYEPCDIGTTCPSNNTPAYRKFTYEGTTNIQNADSFYFMNCCMNGTLINLNNPSSQSVKVSAYVNVSNAPNTQPFSQIDLSELLFTNDSIDVDFDYVDVDGDSVYILPYRYYINYGPGYSATNPTGGYFAINNGSQTNNLTYTCPSQGIYGLNFWVNEKRAGVANSWHSFFISTNRNSLFNTNSVPTISAIGFINTIDTATVGVAETYILTPSNTSASNFPYLHYISLPSGMTVTHSNTIGGSDTLRWTPTAAQANHGWTSFQVRVGDSLCGHNTYNYWIYVSSTVTPPPPNPDSVWAGDADNSKIVSLTDALYVGLAYGDTGVVRPNATSTWQAEFCHDWIHSFNNGVNHKHADCNGDGKVDTLDLIPIVLNYGMSHPKTTDTSGKVTANNEIAISSAINQATGKREIYFDLTGSTANISDLYAVTMDIAYDSYHQPGQNWSLEPKSFSNSSSVMFGNSFLPFYVDQGQNKISVAISRTDQQNANPIGRLFTLSTLDYGSAEIELSNIVLYKNDEKTAYSLTDASETVYPLSTSTLSPKDRVRIYPNPAKDKLHIVGIEAKEIQSLIIWDIVGREYLSMKNVELEVDLPSIPPGFYFIDLRLAEDNQVRLPLEISY